MNIPKLVECLDDGARKYSSLAKKAQEENTQEHMMIIATILAELADAIRQAHEEPIPPWS